MRQTLTAFALIAFLPALHGAAEDILTTPVSHVSPALPADFMTHVRETPVHKPLPRSWKWSLAPLVASQGLDVASSYGMRELNPALAGSDGRFGVKGAALKLGLTGALVGAEYLIVKAHPGAARFFTSINWSGAALTTGFAAHNFSIK